MVMSIEAPSEVPSEPPGRAGALIGRPIPGAAASALPARVLDPYWLWADLTGYSYLLEDPEGLIRIAGAVRNLPELDGKPSAGKHQDHAARYLSRRISKPCTAELQARLATEDFVLAQPGMKQFGVEKNAARNRARPRAAGELKKCGHDVVIGVIDGRCGFANQRFCEVVTESGRDLTTSRIDFFWDQGEDPVGPWKNPYGFDYGRELDGAALSYELGNRLTAKAIAEHGNRGAAERALYRALGHRLPEDADWSHGTHVLDTILTDLAGPRAERNGEVEAPHPAVIYVQLPDEALLDTSGRWAASYVLDGLRYICDRAKADAHVVVNLSLGSFGGPHDGSSLLERAIDDLIDEKGGRLTVVVAAGNAGRVVDDGTGQLAQCHVRATLEPRDGSSFEDLKSVELEWLIDVADKTDSFMEIWIPELERDGKHSSVSVSLSALNSTRGPSTSQLPAADPGQFITIPHDASGKGPAFAAVINATGPYKSPNGRGGMVLVALGHTGDTTAPCTSIGRWMVKVTNTSPWPITVDACIERRDVPGGLVGFRPQYGFGPGTGGCLSRGSLGSLANGKNTLVVGAVERASADQPYRISAFSSVGVAGTAGECNARAVSRRGPDVFSTGERRAAGFLTGSTKTLAGTSMAAAQVTAAVASQVAARDDRAVRRREMIELLFDQARRRALESEPSSSPEFLRLTIDGRRSAFVLPPLPALDH